MLSKCTTTKWIQERQIGPMTKGTMAQIGALLDFTFFFSTGTHLDIAYIFYSPPQLF